MKKGQKLLVVDATTGQNAVTAELFTRQDVSGLVLAKLDGTAGGIIIASLLS